MNLFASLICSPTDGHQLGARVGILRRKWEPVQSSALRMEEWAYSLFYQTWGISQWAFHAGFQLRSSQISEELPLPSNWFHQNKPTSVRSYWRTDPPETPPSKQLWTGYGARAHVCEHHHRDATQDTHTCTHRCGQILIRRRNDWAGARRDALQSHFDSFWDLKRGRAENKKCFWQLELSLWRENWTGKRNKCRGDTLEVVLDLSDGGCGHYSVTQTSRRKWTRNEHMWD